jgi:hypothetical protein
MKPGRTVPGQIWPMALHQRPGRPRWPLQRHPTRGHHGISPRGGVGDKGSPVASGWRVRWHENEDGRRKMLGNKGALEVYRSTRSTWRRQFGPARRRSQVAVLMRWSPAAEMGSCSFRRSPGSRSTARQRRGHDGPLW